MINNIEGPQSTIEIRVENNTKIIRKVATKRGERDLLEQVEFYKELPINLRHYFPNMLRYNNSICPYFYEYEYINFTQLREVINQGKISEKYIEKIYKVFHTIISDIHSVIQKKPEKNYAFDLYINRSINRIEEASKMASIDLMNMPIIIEENGYEFYLKSIVDYLEKNLISLEPEFVCTTHGQLGPAHLFLSEDNEDFKLIDPKGFKNLQDPLIDFCKIGKAMMFGTEFIEVGAYKLDYFISNCINVKSFKFTDANINELHIYYKKILGEFKQYLKGKERRLLSMILADLVGGLPFAYKTNGEERMIALIFAIGMAFKEVKIFEEVK